MGKKVSSLSLSLPISVQPKVTVEQALKITEQKGLNQLQVVSAPGLFLGVATLAGIRGMIGKEEISFSDQIETTVSLTPTTLPLWSITKNYVRHFSIPDEAVL